VRGSDAAMPPYVKVISLCSAGNVTLPAFAAERRRLLQGARRAPAAVDERSAADPPAAVAGVHR